MAFFHYFFRLFLLVFVYFRPFFLILVIVRCAALGNNTVLATSCTVRVMLHRLQCGMTASPAFRLAPACCVLSLAPAPTATLGRHLSATAKTVSRRLRPDRPFELLHYPDCHQLPAGSNHYYTALTKYCIVQSP